MYKIIMLFTRHFTLHEPYAFLYNKANKTTVTYLSIDDVTGCHMDVTGGCQSNPCEICGKKTDLD